MQLLMYIIALIKKIQSWQLYLQIIYILLSVQYRRDLLYLLS